MLTTYESLQLPKLWDYWNICKDFLFFERLLMKTLTASTEIS